jgi:hypothetical protein
MPLTALRHVRKMRGGAQSHLLEADDGHWYVVKFRNNPQHRRILVNELLSAELLRYLKIAVPETALIHITPEFLEGNRDVHLSLGSQPVEVEPGWHFGSAFPGDPDRLAVYDFLPDALLGGLANIAHFLGVLVADKWMANADSRQAIFFRSRVKEWTPVSPARPPRTAMVAQMMDHGFAFDGPAWDFADSPIQDCISAAWCTRKSRASTISNPGWTRWSTSRNRSSTRRTAACPRSGSTANGTPWNTSSRHSSGGAGECPV